MVVPVVLLAVLLGGGYVAGDVYDVVPGALTMRPERAADPPFPQPQLPEPAPLEVVADPADAEQPSTQDLASLRADLVADPVVGTAGVLVTDVLTGTDLDAADAEAGHVPASTTKLLTAAAAVAAAGADHRFTTSVVSGGEGEIILVGGGDLALAAGAGDPETIIGHAGLADLAQATADALAAAGTARVSVGLDLSYYAGPDMAPRWDEIDLAVGDAMHMAPLAIDIGRIEGARPRAIDPAGDAAAAFVDALVAAGITVEGEVAGASAPEGAVELASVTSAPLRDLVAYMLQHSENILSEGLGRLVAHEQGEEPSFDGAGTAIGDVLAGLGVDVEGLALADSTGLSSTNLISPRTLVGTLLEVASRPELGSVARGLPVGGLEGTLSTRLDETPAAGMVAAKTGTLRTVASLSGYVTTADGRLLAFAVLVGDVPTGNIAGARDAIDSWVTGVASCGC
ncbi:D-alanyl-D-alanine carboxypeptidase/D-alanyl-D-alanine endopeptidase [Pseudactinotalea suaedae]|uniref:D-alanyl-D-alanine carboxypeptidase/D-alanyl-D-alanine endopeptidase n=1 Tax=Pseudactinotalea suaedae TaxID=1524924 RepID=UPI0012E20478|nr:D-alanyl-D-alanine carboxypeptidase/D-alanyl-D-alanine-endopeptidase [Pseudactinotalea suaedae]